MEEIKSRLERKDAAFSYHAGISYASMCAHVHTHTVPHLPCSPPPPLPTLA